MCQEPYIKGTLFNRLGGNCIYLCTVIEKGHIALSIDPYLSIIFDPIPPEKGVGFQEESLFVPSYLLDIPSWGTFGLAILTGGAQAPFSGAVPSFQFKWAADPDGFIKCSVLLQW